MDKESLFLKRNKIITLEGWLTRCNQSFIKHSELIKTLLTPIRKYRKEVDLFHRDLRNSYELIIGIHIRKDPSDIYGNIVVGTDSTPLNLNLAQKKLIKFGFDLGNEGEDGTWGEKSETAFQKYQSIGLSFGESEILDNYDQTEFLGHRNHAYTYSFAEYANLIRSLIRLFKNKKVAFLISSDSKVDLRYFKKLPIYLATGHFIEDNYSLSKCDYIIGVASTYTFWSSFLGSVPLYPFANEDIRPDLSDYKNFKINISDFRVCNHLF